MIYKKHILFLLVIFLSGTLHAQDKKSSYSRSKTNYQSREELIQQAKELKETDPTEAIRLLEVAINQSRKKKIKSKSSNNADVFILLGNIYEQINQKDLAIQRYQQSLSLMGKKDNADMAVVYERLGLLNLALGNDEVAETQFQNCISYSINKTLTLRCEEGLADVALFRNDTGAVNDQLESIEGNYKLDSLEQSRNEARRAQNYIQQNDYSKASESFQNSLNSLPEKNKLSKEETAPIVQAKEKILDYGNISGDQKIEIREKVTSNTKSNFSNEALVLENLKIAELYEGEKNFLDAERFVIVAKDLIDVNTNADIAADVYKKSSELNQRKGKMDLALNDLEKYITAKESAISDLEENLKEQIEVVKGQQQIDIQQRDYDLEEKDQVLLASRLRTQQIITGLLSLVLLASLVFFYFLYKNVKEKRKANQLLLLKSLRTQMNPHFIFNALNSVNNFIAKNDEKAANKYLSDFSKLMRKVLDYSQTDFIAFEEEIELNQLYLKLEHLRFRDKFDYQFENNTGQSNYNLQVPPMLIQPFIENAIWHGLRYKADKGFLKVIIKEVESKLIVRIEDNGIGREKSMALKTKNQKKYKSTGMKNVTRSMALINEIYAKNYQVLVDDLSEGEETGTVVEIRIPIG